MPARQWLVRCDALVKSQTAPSPAKARKSRFTPRRRGSGKIGRMVSTKASIACDYVIGSGEHASGYLVDIGGHLFQSPVAYYKSRQSYDLAPGYENLPDPDFTRPVSEECVLCHSGISLHVPGTLNQYRPPVFVAEGNHLRTLPRPVGEASRGSPSRNHRQSLKT